MSDFDLNSFLPYQLALAAEKVSRDLSAVYAREGGLTVPEWRVLAHLAQSGEVSVRDIEARVGMEKSRVSRAASRLEGAGFVEKRDHPQDGRLVSLTLTDAGRALMERLVPLALDYQAGLKARLGAADRGLSEALRMILEDQSQ